MNAAVELIEVAGRWRRKASEARQEGDRERFQECVKHARFALRVAGWQPKRLP